VAPQAGRLAAHPYDPLYLIISHLVKGLDYEEVLLAAGLGVWLVVAATSSTPQ